MVEAHFKCLVLLIICNVPRLLNGMVYVCVRVSALAATQTHAIVISSVSVSLYFFCVRECALTQKLELIFLNLTEQRREQIRRRRRRHLTAHWIERASKRSLQNWTE